MMYMKIHGELREVVVTKKKTTRNTYMRVKEDGKVYVTTNFLTTDKKIKNLLEDHALEIIKMADVIDKKNAYQEKFFLLGKEFDIVMTNQKEVRLGENKVFIGQGVNIDKWYKKQAEIIFLKHLNYCYERFLYTIPYPKLKLRAMKTRWGVCNIKEKCVTLNLELIKKNIVCLDYVIIHELAHLIHANHSPSFWKVVEEHFPNYKEIKRQLKSYE